MRGRLGVVLGVVWASGLGVWGQEVVQPARLMPAGEWAAAEAARARAEGRWVVVEPSGRERALYRASVAALVAANAADLATSWGKRESNPILAGRGGRFSGGSLAIKGALTMTSLTIQHFALRKSERPLRALTWVNFALAGGLSGVAVHNAGVGR